MLNSRKLKQYNVIESRFTWPSSRNYIWKDVTNGPKKFGRINVVAVLPGEGQISYTPFIPITLNVQLCSLYCAFQKHANSEVQKPPLQLRFSLPSIPITIISNRRTLTHGNTLNGAKSTNHKSQTMTIWTRWSKLFLSKRSAKMIDGSGKRKRQFWLFGTSEFGWFWKAQL